MLTKRIWQLSGMLALLFTASIIEADDSQGNLKLWQAKTTGNNLALGKKIIFSTISEYRLTAKGGTDEFDLTDGVLSNRKDGRIWFDNKAIGWFYGKATDGINLLLDLGKEAKVDRVVIRCLGGGERQKFFAPRQFDVFVSKDGKKFYQTSSMQKLEPGEKAQSDFNKYYFIDEKQESFVFPFALPVNADARYIGVRIRCDTGALFADEMAVMEATPDEQKNPAFNNAYSGISEDFATKGVLVKPRIGKLAISANIATPTSLMVQDMRNAATAKNAATLVMELPDGITVKAQQAMQQVKIKLNGKDYTRFTTPLLRLKSRVRSQTLIFFFESEKKTVESEKAVFYVLCDGESPLKQSVPVELIEFPEVKPKFKRLHVSLAWMNEPNCLVWPDFFVAWRKLGFNTVSFFPRTWNNSNNKEMQKLLSDAREKGFKILMNESPFHIMAKGHNPGDKLFSQTPDKKSTNLCPSYRGQFYAKELERVADMVRKSSPDFVFWDIECWSKGVQEADKCACCKEGCKASGKPMAEFLKDKGTESFKDLYQAVEKGSADGKMPIVASYNHHVAIPVHHEIIDFNRIYPKYLKMAQPSLYVSGRAQDIHNSIRTNYRLLKNRQILPWLTLGTYGEFEPYKAEYMVLEALLNGACGITYYSFSDFDTPMDFYYHAKALAEIAPYEDLIMDGEVLEPTGTNKQLTYSGIRKGGEMLLLIGNYQNAPGSTTYSAPFGTVTQVKDLRSGKTLPAKNPIKLDVPKDRIMLLYITGK